MTFVGGSQPFPWEEVGSLEEMPPSYTKGDMRSNVLMKFWGKFQEFHTAESLYPAIVEKVRGKKGQGFAHIFQTSSLNRHWALSSFLKRQPDGMSGAFDS